METVADAVAKNRKSKRNLLKTEKSAWQILDDLLIYKSCLMNGDPGGQPQLKKFFKKFEKSSWQTE